MQMLKEFISNLLSKDTENTQPVRAPFFRTLFTPFIRLIDNINHILAPILTYTVALTILSYAFGFTYQCLYTKHGQDVFFCSKNIPLYVLYSLIKLLILSSFAAKTYKIKISKKGFLPDFSSLSTKSFAFNFALSIVMLIPFVSIIILYLRVPNPDWFIEILFFGVVSIGFIIPFFSFRLLSVYGFVLAQEPIPPLTKIWKKSDGNLLKFVLGLFFILVFHFMITVSFFGGFNTPAESLTTYLSISSEVFHNIFVLIFFYLWTHHCITQKELLFKESNNEQ